MTLSELIEALEDARCSGVEGVRHVGISVDGLVLAIEGVETILDSYDGTALIHVDMQRRLETGEGE